MSSRTSDLNPRANDLNAGVQEKTNSRRTGSWTGIGLLLGIACGLLFGEYCGALIFSAKLMSACYR